MKLQAKHLIAGAASALALLSGTVALADAAAGEHEYNKYCIACHGTDGRGDGPISRVLKVPVPDLTKISSRRGGDFPMLEVLMIIDGRTGIRGHGYPMPVWGDRFMAEEDADEDSHQREIVVRGRILSLAYFLESIQAK